MNAPGFMRPGLLLRGSALALLLVAPGPGRAQEGIEHFHEAGDFILEIDGTDVPAAKIYVARNPPSILLVTSRLETPVLLHPRSGRVETVDMMKMAAGPDEGSIDLLPGWSLAELGPFTVTEGGTIVAFDVGRAAVRVKPKPALVGFQPTAKLRDYDPEYARKEAAYEPSGPILARLRQQTAPVRVRVFFGTWCPFCGETVPRVMRVAEELDGGSITFEFYGLPRDFAGDSQAEKYDVTGVPTGVVFVDGKEVGRISGNSWKVPELALNRLLVGS